MGRETITITRCDRCKAEIKDASSDDTFKIFKYTTMNILNIYVRCWDRHDEYYLCKDCFERLREFLNEAK